MNILLADKWFRRKDASSKYFFGLRQCFLRHGHSVVDFSMRDRRNEPSPYEDYFVDHIDFNKYLGVTGYARAGLSAIYNRHAKERLSRLLDRTRVDIALLFNIYHHLSPSILVALQERAVPAVMLLADYNLICPSYRLFAHSQTCEKCKGGAYWHATAERCFKGSFWRSAAASIVAYAHQWQKAYDGRVAAFIAPSRFVKDKFVEFGFGPDSIEVIPHALPLQGYEPGFTGVATYFVYLGILEPWKGIGTLIEAMRLVPEARLVILGQGSAADTLRRQVVDRGIGNISWRGYLSEDQMHDVVRGAVAVVVPSEWYEVFGTVIWEAFAMGKPVVGANIGGIPELVRDDETGYTFRAGDVRSLADALRKLWSDPIRARTLGRVARRRTETDLSLDENYRKTMALLTRVLPAGSASPHVWRLGG